MLMIRRQLVNPFSAVRRGDDVIVCPAEYVPDQIRKRAYQLFEDRGRRRGHELDDWLEAERQIRYELELWKRYELMQLHNRFRLPGKDKDRQFNTVSQWLQSDEKHYSNRRREMSFHE